MSEKKENKIQTLSIEEEIQNVRNKILNWDPNSSGDELKEIDAKLALISQKNKLKTKESNFFFFITLALFIISGVFIFVFIQGEKYKSELESRLNDQIKTSNKQDSLFNKYLGVDSLGNYSTTREKGRLLSYKDLDISRDSIKHENYVLKDSINILNQRIEMANESYGIYYTRKKIGDKTFITIGSKKFEQMEKDGNESWKKIKPLVDSLNKK